MARVIDFSLTIRDNQSPNGGQTNRDDMRVTTANTGPFTITSPSTTNESFPSGATHTITWDVAGTDANGINTSNVNILLSTDGGQNFNTVLASNTPNDGSETISYPIVNEPFCRIKIEPVGNIYFAISKSFSIGANVAVSQVCNPYTTGAIATAIPDGSGTTSPQAGAPAFASLMVSETTAITDLRVSVDVTHPFVGDLLLQLLPPNTSDFVNVWILNCGGNSDIDVTFQDGFPPIQCGSPTQGTFSPVEVLSDLNGINPSGIWSIAAVDFFLGDTGTINEFAIELCTTTTTITLDNETFELNDFALYPNPNKGEFNLQFNSNSGLEINFAVYDISGKLIHTKTYDATARFEKNIVLNNVSTGLYIMKVTDGDNTITKKLIIE